MKKKILIAIAVLLGSMLLAFGVPITINECYKAGGYITLWDAADVLGYYGIILGAVVSIGILAVTIYYNRCQLVQEAKRQSQMRKWQMIEQSTTDALDAIHPYNLRDIALNDIEQSSVKLYESIVEYRINAKKAVDRFRLIIDTEDYSLAKNLSNKIQRVTQQCIDLQQEYIKLVEDGLQDQLGTKYMQEHDNNPAMIQIYKINILRKSMERVKKLTQSIEKVYEEDYCPLVSQKAEIFSEIYRHIAESGVGERDNADT